MPTSGPAEPPDRVGAGVVEVVDVGGRRSVPSSSTAIVTSHFSWRACADAMRFSRRSSLHLTAAPSTCAASTIVDLLAADERLEAEAAADVADLHPDLVLGHAGGAARTRGGPRAGSGSTSTRRAAGRTGPSCATTPRHSIGTIV